MKKIYESTLGLLMLAWGLTFAGCSPEGDPVPETSLAFTIVDEAGNPLEGATVRLFDSEASFLQEEEHDVLASGQSNTEGKVTITKLEPQTYYFSVIHGTTTILTNWEGIVHTEQPVEENKISAQKVVLKESVLYYLTAEKKGWMLDKVYMGEEDYTAQMDECHMDDIMRFGREYSYILSQGATKCNSSAPQEEVGQFQLSGTTLRTIGEDGEETVLNVLEISATALEMSGGDLRPDVRMVYKATP